MTAQPHKLPLTPHVPRLQAPLAHDGQGALVTLVHDLMAELRAKDRKHRIKHLALAGEMASSGSPSTG